MSESIFANHRGLGPHLDPSGHPQRQTPRGEVIQDLYGDTADLHPRVNYQTGETDGVHLTVDLNDPDGNRLDFDLDGAKKLRDALTRIIDAQEAGQ